MSERKLASIRVVSNVEPIEGADLIEKVTVDGWTLVSNKENNWKVGDLCVYFETDAVLPECEEFEFLRDRCYVPAERSVNGAGFRLKTIKLRGVVSQGLILPLDLFFEKSVDYETFQPLFKRIGGSDYITHEDVQDEIGQSGAYDLTEILGVVKFERPLPTQLAGVARGNFPSFIQKTDQERIQNCYKYLHRKWDDHKWEVSMKLDGSSMTVYYRTHPDIDGGQFSVCSRNLDLTETEGNSFWQVARKLNLEAKMRDIGRNIAIQGELMGPGIQGNKEGLTDLKFFVFDIWDIDKQEYLHSNVRRAICQILEIEHVPIVTEVQSLKEYNLQQILRMADGPSLNAKLREGLVFKSLNDPSISWKAISNKWLLKVGD